MNPQSTHDTPQRPRPRPMKMADAIETATYCYPSAWTTKRTRKALERLKPLRNFPYYSHLCELLQDELDRRLLAEIGNCPKVAYLHPRYRKAVQA